MGKGDKNQPQKMTRVKKKDLIVKNNRQPSEYSSKSN